MFERFTDQSRQVLVLAQEEARLLDHNFIGTEHILLGLIRADGSIASQVLAEVGVELPTVRERVRETIGLAGGATTGSPPFTPRAKKVLELALREVQQLGGEHIGTEHILLGLIREGEGVGAQVLVSLGIDPPKVRQRVIQRLAEAHGKGGAGSATEGFTAAGRGRNVRARMVTCSFCGLSPPETGQLISGGNAFICERCIRSWSSRLGSAPIGQSWISRSPGGTLARHTSFSAASSDVVTPGEQPANPDSARAEIVTVFTDYSALSEDGRSAIRVEKGANLGWAVGAAKANRAAYLDREIIFTVDDVIFVDPEHAAVWFSISVNGGQVLDRHPGDAVLIDGEWKMALSTFRQMMAMAGVALPPAVA
jgi:hypothetical protein